jgi:aryl-alcohol dehydrogenase-like predicted oxidoreductase
VFELVAALLCNATDSPPSWRPTLLTPPPAQVSDSLKKLRTSYIDLLYVHWWDYTTSVEEVMLALNDLVREGKVMYLGVSDTPGEFIGFFQSLRSHIRFGCR